jgi:UDP-glucose 4-epimerase
VTGGAGFIGSHLSNELFQHNYNVFVVDDFSSGNKGNLRKGIQSYDIDVRNYDSIAGVIKEVSPNHVCHLAANASTRERSMGWDAPYDDLEVNTGGTLNILRAIIDSELSPYFVFTSSAAVYGEPSSSCMGEDHPKNPVSPYGVSKLSSEKYINAYRNNYNIRGVSLRIFNCYGPYQTRYVMYDFFKKMDEDPTTLEVIGSGKQVRTYCYVKDAARAIRRLIDKRVDSDPINLAGEDVISIKRLAEKIANIHSPNVDTEIYCTGSSWDGDIKKLEASTEKIKKKIDFKPKTSLDEGLEELYLWMSRTG